MTKKITQEELFVLHNDIYEVKKHIFNLTVKHADLENKLGGKKAFDMMWDAWHSLVDAANYLEIEVKTK